MAFLAVFIGGGIGSLFRYIISLLIPFSGSGFPWATLIANVISSFILGISMAYLIKHGISDNMKFLLMTGFCGGFSTFSTFSAESLLLFQEGQIGLALLYIVISIVLGIGSIYLGFKVL